MIGPRCKDCPNKQEHFACRSHCEYAQKCLSYLANEKKHKKDAKWTGFFDTDSYVAKGHIACIKDKARH